MIRVKINGGLGNQLFQYASGYAFARDNQTELIVDISDALDYKVHSLRLTQLSCSARFDENKSFMDRLLLHRRFIKMTSTFLPHYYIEPDLLYNNKLKSIADNKKLIGYFQSELYFNHYREELLKEFSPKNKFSAYQDSVLKLIKGSNALSIHVRRGDYIANPEANIIHGLCDINYFERAIDFLEEKGLVNLNTKIFLFSDDIHWCKENVRFKYDTILINDDFNEPELDMWLMSNCNNHIISNSTFSWWGAWLNNDINKVVIAPKNWFANGMETNIQPESWILL